MFTELEEFDLIGNLVSAYEQKVQKRSGCELNFQTAIGTTREA